MKVLLCSTIPVHVPVHRSVHIVGKTGYTAVHIPVCTRSSTELMPLGIPFMKILLLAMWLT